MRFRPTVLVASLILLLALTAACSSGSSPQPAPAPRTLPTAVEFAQEPTGATRGDPSFESLPGAQAHFGELGGSVYQIEIPDDWNGRLVLYLHGFANFAPTLSVQQPAIRMYLIERGFA
ncbi:MAG: hypothetical protein IH865_11110 [Chloroflexi bacterium]|nr:hypothetical protein [Chloroflexota bacterium]